MEQEEGSDAYIYVDGNKTRVDLTYNHTLIGDISRFLADPAFFDFHHQYRDVWRYLLDTRDMMDDKREEALTNERTLYSKVLISVNVDRESIKLPDPVSD